MDSINFNQLEHLQARYVGTGHSDTSKREWIVTQHKDTYASFLGHPNLRAYVSLASSECMERTRVKLIESMVRPLTRRKSSLPPEQPAPRVEAEAKSELRLSTLPNENGEEDMALD